jgi:hypothetical protein
MPRFSLDRFLAVGISIGVGLSYQRRTNSERTTSNAVSKDDTSFYLLAPRIGIAIPIRSWFQIWPRVGASYVHLKGDHIIATGGWYPTEWNHTDDVLYLGADTWMVASPFEHLAITAGPTFDRLVIGPTRSVKGLTVDAADVHSYSFGFHSGIAVWF